MASGESLVDSNNKTFGEGDEEAPPRSRSQSSRCCPCNLCCCLGSCGACVPIPSTYRIVQDFTHGCLLAGIVGGIALVVEAVYGIREHGHCRPSKLPCCEEVLTFASVLPCVFIINQLIGMYDSQLTEKEEDAKRHRKLLEEKYGSLTKSMEGLLTKATQSSATMAERNFDDHRRDFQRFLQKAKMNFPDEDSGESQLLLKEFRKFIFQWLKVFEEVSVDPINYPRKVIRPEELESKRTIAEVVDFVLLKLKATEVKFISAQRANDAKMLGICESERKSIRRRYSSQLNSSLDIPVDGQAREIEMTAIPEGKKAMTPPQQQNLAPTAGRKIETAPPYVRSEYGMCSWWSCGCFGCGCQSFASDRPEESYPFQIQLLCLQVMMFSQAHFTLTIGWLAAVALCAMEAINFDQIPARNETIEIRIVSIAFYSLCVCNLLMRFEQIDTVQRLVNELSDLEAENRRVQERHDGMKQFWNNTQQLLDLWVHRTMPRLNLLGEVHEHIEDADEENVLPYVQRANIALQDVESQLPELQLWRQDGGLNDGVKKAFSQRIDKICHADTLDLMLLSLKKEMGGDGLLRVEAGTASPSSGAKRALAAGASTGKP